ncbi:MAG: hypothetical protein ACK58L_10380 [Planctomycetota bacterium]
MRRRLAAVPSAARTVRPRRGGKLIIQVMVHMTLLSAMLGLGGFCLHAALRMDRSDLKDSFLIRSLLRCERQLRQDASKSRIVVNSASSVTFVRNERVAIVWTTDRGVLTRELSEAGQFKSRDQFPFPAGTAVEFRSDDSVTAVIRITEPTDLVKYAEAADGSAHRTKPEGAVHPPVPDGAATNRAVEIFLRGLP